MFYFKKIEIQLLSVLCGVEINIAEFPVTELRWNGAETDRVFCLHSFPLMISEI